MKHRFFTLIAASALLLTGLAPASSAAERTYSGGEAVARIAKTYFDAVKSGEATFIYHDNFDSDGVDGVRSYICSNYMDCSMLALLSLTGVSYANYPNRTGDVSRFFKPLSRWTDSLYGINPRRVYSETEKADRIIDVVIRNDSGAALPDIYPNREAHTGFRYRVYWNEKIYELSDAVPFVHQYRMGEAGTYFPKVSADLASVLLNDSDVLFRNPKRYTRTVTVKQDQSVEFVDVWNNRAEYAANAAALDLSLLRPGDLLFYNTRSDVTFSDGLRRNCRFFGISHVAIVSEDPRYLYEAENDAQVLHKYSIYTDNLVLILRPHYYETLCVPASDCVLTGCAGQCFLDMPDKLRFSHNAIDWAIERSITDGTSKTRFSPTNPCTRAQIVTFLWRAAGEPPVEGDPLIAPQNPFTDVKEDAYYYNAVLWAVDNGITAGTDETHFSPDDACTRAQLVTFLWRAAGSPSSEAALPFSDVRQDAYYRSAVVWAYRSGVASGVTRTEFRPKSACTREQAVTFLYRAR